MSNVTGSDAIGGTNQSADNDFGDQSFWFEWIELTGTSTSNLTQAGFNIADGSLGAGQTVYNAGGTNSLDVPAQSGSLGNSGNDFAVRVSTTLTVSNGGDYTFELNSDDGSRLYIDGVELLNYDGLHAANNPVDGTINLAAGEYEIVIIHFERGGSASLSTTIQGPDYASTVALEDADVQANTGDDVVDAGAGDDQILAGDGDDSITGGDGNDQITLGVGDEADGGADDDVFSLDFDLTSSSGSTSIDIDGGTDGTDNDTLDLTGLGGFTLTETTDPDGDSTSGTAVFDSGQTVTFSEIENLIVCFAEGTQVKTDNGVRSIETLTTNDKLVTRDNGLQDIRWIGKRTVNGATLAAYPKLMPIRIDAGALGPGIPSRELVVSPQHRIVVRSKIAVRMFDTDEVLIAAKHLLGVPGVNIADDLADSVTYFHILCDNHEIIDACGAYAETLHTGEEALKTMTPAALEEITLIFGAQALAERPLALDTPKGSRAKQLIERHRKNSMALFS